MYASRPRNFTMARAAALVIAIGTAHVLTPPAEAPLTTQADMIHKINAVWIKITDCDAPALDV